MNFKDVKTNISFPMQMEKNTLRAGFHPLIEHIYIDADFMTASYFDRRPEQKSPTKIQQPLSQPSTSNFENQISPTLISPMMIRPHPKAELYEGTQKGRYRGRSEY